MKLTFLVFIALPYLLHAQFSSHLISSAFDDAFYSHFVDIDDDGDLDLVFDQGNVYLFKNLNGKGNFGELVQITSVGGEYIKSLDADNDGDIELIHTRRNDVFISLNNDGMGINYKLIKVQKTNVNCKFSQQIDYIYKHR